MSSRISVGTPMPRNDCHNECQWNQRQILGLHKQHREGVQILCVFLKVISEREWRPVWLRLVENLTVAAVVSQSGVAVFVPKNLPGTDKSVIGL